MRGTNSTSLASSIVPIRTGSRSVFTLVKSIVDPALAVLCLLGAQIFRRNAPRIAEDL